MSLKKKIWYYWKKLTTDPGIRRLNKIIMRLRIINSRLEENHKIVDKQFDKNNKKRMEYYQKLIDAL